MVKRFRMVAGPNGSGKSTLVKRLQDDYKVNFYTFVNADDILAQVLHTGAYSPKFPVSKAELVKYAEESTYDEEVKAVYRGEAIRVDGDCVHFEKSAINSYTIALFANFLQDRFLDRGESFSQETVFSHPSKVAAIDGRVADRAQIMSELAMCSRYAREHAERYTGEQVFGGIRERIHAGRRLQG